MAAKFKRFAKYGLYALVLVSLGIAARKYLNGEAIVAALRAFNWLYAPLILGLTILYLFLKGACFMVFLKPLVDYGRWAIMRAYLAGQVATLLPAGGAARVVVLKQVGVSLPKGGAAVLFASLTDQAILIGGMFLAAIWFEEARLPALIAIAVLAAIAVLLWIKPVRTRLLGTAAWFMEKVHLEDKWRSFQTAFDEGITLGVVLRGLAFTVAAFALMPLALGLALRGLGLAVPPGTLVLAFILPILLGHLSSLPGGVGVTEASMVAILSAVQGVDANLAAAAVAVFRVGTVFFAAVFGGFVYLVVRARGGVKAAPS